MSGRDIKFSILIHYWPLNQKEMLGEHMVSLTRDNQFSLTEIVGQLVSMGCPLENT